MKEDEEAPQQLPLQEAEAKVKERRRFPIMAVAIVYAMFNLTLTGLGALTLFGTFLYWTISVVLELKNRGPPQVPPLDREAQNMHDFFNISMCSGMLVLVMFAAIALVFAIVLVQGVLKKKSNLVRAYFIYAIVMLILCFTSGGCYFLLTDGKDKIPAAIAISIISFYTVVLVFIRMAYLEIEKDMVQCSPSSDMYMDQDPEDKSPVTTPIHEKHEAPGPRYYHTHLEVVEDPVEVAFVINESIKFLMESAHDYTKIKNKYLPPL